MRTLYLPAFLLSFPFLLATGCSGPQAINVQPGPNCRPTTPPAHAYVLNDFTNSIFMFSADSCTGALTATSPASISTGANSFGSEQMVVDPAGRFAYVANLGSNATDLGTISMFTINATTGILTPTTPAMVPTGFLPQGIGIDPLGRFVYTANSDDNSVSMFTIDQTTGVLTPTNPPEVAAGWSPVAVSVDPTGKFAYAANEDDGSLSMYTINQTTGMLTPTAPASISAFGSPFDIAFDPSGKFAYAPDGFGQYVAQFTVDQTTGLLSDSTPPGVISGQSPTAVAVAPSGKFAYAVNRQDNTITGFMIDASTGSLASLGTVATGIQPFRAAVDPTGKFVYVTNESGSISIYAINADGTLPSGSLSPLPGTPVSVVLTMPASVSHQAAADPTETRLR